MLLLHTVRIATAAAAAAAPARATPRMGKQSRRIRSEIGSSNLTWPNWSSYIDNKKKMTKVEMLQDVLSKMPKEHPMRAEVEKTLTKAAHDNAAALTADTERNKEKKKQRQLQQRQLQEQQQTRQRKEAILDQLRRLVPRAIVT